MIRIVGTALYQWDTGRYVTTDIEADHIHFSNKGDSKAVIMDLASSQAKIPDYLLQTGKQLCVYVVRNGITVESNVFSVNHRERPENYIYEEDQRNFVYALIVDAQAATEAAKQAAKEASDVADAIKKDAASGKFKGEKGDPGEQGPKGEKGDPAPPTPNPDWNQDNPDSADYILNKPDIGGMIADQIDDANTYTDKTWSSKKISDTVIAFEGEPASANLFNKDDAEAVKNYYLDARTGDLVAYNYRHTTGYIPVKNGKSYTFPADLRLLGSTLAKNTAIYNSDKEYIGYVVGTITNGLNTITINNENAAYIRTSINQSSTANDYGYYWTIMMVVDGTEYPSEYIAYMESTLTPVLRLDLREEYINSLLNPLYRKTIVFAGDSICEGKAFGDANDGWAGRVSARNQMTYKNYGVSGSTITEKLAYYSGGTEKPSVSGRVETMHTDYPNADYIIFEGGTNDADLIGSRLNGDTLARFGTFTNTNFSGNYDRETFCGALESIFYRATNYWKGKKIGFIVAHKMGRTTNGYTAETNNRRNYFETAMAICKKWGIPVLNLWDGCHLNPSLPHMYTYGKTPEENEAAGNYYADGQHLLSAGYDYVSDIINNWLKTL